MPSSDPASLRPNSEPLPFLDNRNQPAHTAQADEEETAIGKGFIYKGSEPVAGYKLVRPLGKGGFGEVWEAKGPGGFSMALKFIHLQGYAGAVEVRSLDLMKSLRHPNLLSMFGAWERNGYLIVAMELAEGTLYDYLKKSVAKGQPGIAMDELLEFLYEAAKGIDFLNEPRHSLGDGVPPIGIQHRDIKPQNILLLGGSAKVADFGLAKLLESTVCASSGSMSPAYSAPEFSMGKTTRWSDQYSLAVSYCQLRGNKLPFTGTLSQIVAGHMSLPPDLSMIPGEQERKVVGRALAKKPEQRWESCRQFVEALLDSYAQQNPIQAAGVKFPSSTSSSIRRRMKPMPPPIEEAEPESSDDLATAAELPAPPPPRKKTTEEPPPLPVAPASEARRKPGKMAVPPMEPPPLPPMPAAGAAKPKTTTKQQVQAPTNTETEEPPVDPNRTSSLILLVAVLIVLLFVTVVVIFAKMMMP